MPKNLFGGKSSQKQAQSQLQRLVITEEKCALNITVLLFFYCFSFLHFEGRSNPFYDVEYVQRRKGMLEAEMVYVT